MIRADSFLIHCFVGSFKDKKLHMYNYNYNSKEGIFSINGYYYYFDNLQGNYTSIDLQINIS